MVTLDQILGQVVPVSILKNAIKTKAVGHAYLFSGPDGLGKETVARILARELVNLGGSLSEIHVLGGDEAIKIDEVRTLRKKAALKPAGYSIWIILDAHRLTIEASNGLLKILEEPPVGTYFILTTTQVHSLLSTITSRCQHLPFRQIAEQDIAKWLAEQTNSDIRDVKIQSICKLAQGSLGRAWAYWEGSEFEEREAVIKKLIEIPKYSYPQVLGISQQWPEERTKIATELQLFLEWHRDLLITKNKVGLPLYNPNYERELKENSTFYSDYDLIMIMEQIIEAGKAIARKGRIRFHLGYLLLLMKKGALT